MSEFTYDEFSYFHENLNEWDIDPYVPNVRRFFVTVDGLRQLSGLRWGNGDPELTLLHGGAQNAHTYDTVALALSRHSLLALDLPGHGHSDPSIIDEDTQFLTNILQFDRDIRVLSNTMEVRWIQAVTLTIVMELADGVHAVLDKFTDSRLRVRPVKRLD